MRINAFYIRIGCALALVASYPQAGRAESFFAKLFGWGSSSAPKTETAPRSRPVPSLQSLSRARSTANERTSWSTSEEPLNPDDDANYVDDESGAYRTVCVRTCDGFYFPISSRASSDKFDRDAHRCKAMCGNEAKLYYMPRNSDDPRSMTDISGALYSRLPNAFAYRKSLVNGCACKPMPWTYSETERHKRYALVDALDKAQARNAELAREAELARQAANAAQENEEPITSAAIALKAAAAASPFPERKKPEPEKAAAVSIAGLGHFMPDLAHAQTQIDPVIWPVVSQKSSRRISQAKPHSPVAQRVSEAGGSWFGQTSKYAWPGDAPVRHRVR